MKNNTENTKSLLQKALLQAPDDFVLSEVRYHIRTALSKLENIERKRHKREIKVEERKVKQKMRTQSSVFDPLSVIETIDDLISDQKDKLDDIKQRRKGARDEGSDDELSTVLG